VPLDSAAAAFVAPPPTDISRHVMHQDSERGLRSSRWDRVLFPSSRLRGFFLIIAVSSLFSLLLTGSQILHANWGLIDDHQVFTFLGPDLKLPASEIWSTLLTKTEVGQLQGRFRPSYYVMTLLETWLFGPDVRLWYARNSVCFALFLSGLWWTMSRHVVAWLGGAVIAGIALLPLWADVWSRLGTSEIYGAAFVGIMLFAADAVLFSERDAVRRCGVMALSLAAIVLAGLKETFIPLAAGGTAFVLILAGIERRLSPRLTAVAALPVLAAVVAIGLVVVKELSAASGVDFYGKAAGPGTTILHALLGIFDALLRTWWIFVLPIAFLRLLDVLPRRSLTEWVAGSKIACATYLFLIAMYAAQCGLYRMSFPHNSRYDFPAMLLVPLTFAIVVCEVSRRLRDRFPAHIIDYAQLTAAIFLIFALINANLGRPPELAVAVKRNIATTNAFFSALQEVARAAKQSPDRPIILDAYGPMAFEGIYSVQSYLRAFAVTNAISLRFHPDETFKGAFADLQKAMSDLEKNGDTRFVPLDLALRSRACLSVGLYGPSDSACPGFRLAGNGSVTINAPEPGFAEASAVQ
jgi:hypothetical protein